LRLIEDVPLANFGHNSAVNKKIALIRNDITQLEIDAIVNDANSRLLGGGGIDGAIHRAAGGNLVKECATLNGAETGETKLTRGYKLPAKYVLHTVGPVGRDDNQLKSCYVTCLKLVEKHKIKTVAFCGISTGIFGFPLYPATHIALHAIREWLEVPKNQKKVDLIILCTFLEKEEACYQKLFPMYFPPQGNNTEEVVSMYKKSFTSYNPTTDTSLDEEAKEWEDKENERIKQKEAFKRRKEEKPSSSDSTKDNKDNTDGREEATKSNQSNNNNNNNSNN